jgi:hypothetical protein
MLTLPGFKGCGTISTGVDAMPTNDEDAVYDRM